MKKALTILLLTVCLGGFAHAGILIEPNVGYDFGDAKRTTLLGVSGTESISGVSYGLRLGYKFLVPWVALDYSMSDQKNEDNESYKKTALGAVIGADLPIGIRIFGGYGFDEKFDNEGAELAGTYTKVGLGMKLVPMIAFNVEYIMHKLEKVDDVDVDTLFSKAEYNSIYLSLSIPFNL